MTITRLPRNRTVTNQIAGIYVRISDDREGRELGVERQTEDGLDLAKRLGIPVHRIYKDNDIGASTRSAKPRPEYKAMLADARAGVITVIIAYTSGRLTRRPREHEDQIELAEQCGTQFQYLRSPSFDLNTSAGRRVARILAATDAGEAEDIGERVARARHQRAEQGRFGGGTRPYGWGVQTSTIERPNRKTGELEIAPVYDYDRVVESEADTLRMMANWVLCSPSVSLRTIARLLNDRGIPAARGGQWLPIMVRDTLCRPRAAGILTSNGVEVGRIRDAAGNLVVPPLAEEVWRNVVAKLRDPARRTNPGGPRLTRWLGSGIYTCWRCGGVLRAHTASQHKEQPVYRDGHVTRVAGPLDVWIRALVIERLSRPDAIDLIKQAEPGVDVNALRVERDVLRTRQAGLAETFAEGAITREQLAVGTKRLAEKLLDVEQQLAQQINHSPLTPLVTSEDVAAAWDALPLGAQRAVVAALFKIVVKAAPRGAGFDPRYIQVSPVTQ